jgi:hypothetical protein
MPVTGLRIGSSGHVVITATQGFAAFIVQVNKWELDWPNDYFPHDTFGDVTGTGPFVPVAGHKFYRGQYAPTGTISGYCDGRAFGSAHDPSGIPSATLYLVERNDLALAYVTTSPHPAGSVVYKGSAFLNVKISVDRQTGLNSYTATFKGHGDWSDTVTAS